jgi:DNA-binding MarR family transcriptional regulator
MATRRRDTVLHAIDLFRRQAPGLTLTHLVVFLYAAENQGITLSELAQLIGMNLPTTSRAARALMRSGLPNALPPNLDLLEVRTNPDNTSGRIVILSPKGQQMVEKLDRAIQAAIPIRGETSLSLAVG